MYIKRRCIGKDLYLVDSYSMYTFIDKRCVCEKRLLAPEYEDAYLCCTEVPRQL